MESLKEIWRRLRVVPRQRQLEADLEEEMRFHLEMKARDNRESGMAAGEAARAAARQFGNATLLREDSREAWAWTAVERIGKDLRVSLRMFRKDAGFTAVAVLTLAFGIGAATAVFSVIDGVLLKPLPYRDPARLVAVLQTRGQSGPAPASYANFQDWRARSRTIERMAFVSIPMTIAVIAPQADILAGAGVDSAFFDLLGARPALGRLFRPGDYARGGEQVCVLTWNAWQRQFGGDPAVVGRKLQSGSQNRTIVGILPAGYRQPRLNSGYRDPDVFIPLDLSLVRAREAGLLHVIGRLRPGVAIAAASAEMAEIGRGLAAQYPANRNTAIQTVPLAEMLTGKMRRPLFLLLGAVLVLLLCACVNMANLLLARSIQRQREFAIRAALGGRRGLLFAQVIVEGLALSAAGALLGMALAWFGVRWLMLAAGPLVPRSDQVSVNASALFFTLGVACLTALIFASAPAFVCSRRDLFGSLQSEARAGETSSVGRARSVLVSAEVALSVVLLTGAVLLLRSYWRVLDLDMGCQTAGVVTADLNLPGGNRSANLLEEYVARVGALPGVESAGAAATVPLALSPTPELSVEIVNHPAPAGSGQRTASVLAATPGYFHAMRIALRRGRYFKRGDGAASTPVVLVNEAFVRRFLPGEDPLGRVLDIGAGGGQNFASGRAAIVGVVADVRQKDVLADPAPQIWKPHTQCAWPYMTLAVRAAGGAPELAPVLRRELRAVDASLPLTNIRSADSYYAEALAQRRLSLLLTGAVAALALLLSGIGVYGMVSYSVRRRRHEIGIRMALGAQAGNVLATIVRQGLTHAGAGLAVGLVVALALSRLLGAVLYGIEPRDPLTFSSVVLIYAAVAAAAAWFPGRKATRVDPATALRTE